MFYGYKADAILPLGKIPLGKIANTIRLPTAGNVGECHRNKTPAISVLKLFWYWLTYTSVSCGGKRFTKMRLL